MSSLLQIHSDIDQRVTAIQDAHRDWLCRLGCDGCCRRLAEIPSLSAEEWNWLREGLNALPSEQLQQIGRQMAELVENHARPLTCPLLDRKAGACRVYVHRPIACRTYGFYVQRGLGLYCKDIETRVAAGQWADVVWGNHDAIDHRLSALGEKRDLTDWYFRWKSEKS